MPAAGLAIFTVATLLIVIVFAGVARSTRHEQPVDYAAAQRIRLVVFLSIVGILVTFLVITLPRLPYAVDARAPDRVVEAVGKQYAWSLTEGRTPTLAKWDDEFSPVVSVPVGSLVEFRVTTLDVSHGFSLYGPDGQIVNQTQAMPGYVNRLRVTFDKPGTYTVLCLEFCGMSHHRMRGVVEVQ